MTHATATDSADTRPVLSIRNLFLNFQTSRGFLQALRNVSFDIPPKSIVGLVGESGCGKSTVIYAVLRLLSENASFMGGRIDFKGENILEMTPGRLQSIRGDEISVVFQDPMTSLNPVLSIGRQMMDIQYRLPIGAAQKRERVIRMLDRVGIPDAANRLNTYPHQFSGGMRQRIAIGMALLAKPSLLIADEPTTALDATLEIQIIDLLRRLHEDIGCSILFVSHHLGLVAEFCDRVVVMYAGEIVESGEVRAVFHHALHPYTRALLECDPARIKTKTRTLPTIPGEIPDLVHPPDQCIYADRCQIKQHGCPLTVPPATEPVPGHLVRCHLGGKGEAP